MEDGKKKIAIITVCSLLLVAMVVALIIVGQDSDDKSDIKDVSASQKAISAICQTTDYQQTCLNSLNGHNSTNPKELMEVAFQAAIDYIKEAIKNSTTLQELQKDPRAKAALETCGELANLAIDDLQRSYAKFTDFDITNVDDILLDLKIWLSGAMTHQETCLDGFDDVWGDAGLKMKDILTTSMQMTSNALAMVAEISTFLESMGIQGFQSRRLLSEDLPVLGHGGEFPDWMDFHRRELLTAPPQIIKPNIVVAKDGTGKYRTINEALKDIPKNSNKTFILYIKEGIYEEQVRINSTFKHLMIIGDGPTKTTITGKLNFIDGTGTYHTATVAVQGDDFIARDIGFENSAGPQKHQAVALRVSADKAIFYNCHMDGYQDTLYAHTYRQFYRDCIISGTIDFIFGDSAAVFQGCTLLVRKPLDNQQNIVTAQGRKDVRQPTALVLQNCTFKADPELHPIRTKVRSYLGRPWKEYSRTIIMESFLDDFIHPDGWLPWNATFALETLFYTEFNNRGPASPKAQRVKWPGVKELPPNRVKRFIAAEFLDGNRWIPPTRVPYAASFIFPVPKEDPNIKYSPVVPEENKDLGLTSTIDKSAFSAPKNTTSQNQPDSNTPPPPASHSESHTPVSVPLSDIASPPTFSHQESDTAASPTSSISTSPLTSVVTIPHTETGELIIDLSLSPSSSPSPSPPASQLDVAATPPVSITGYLVPIPQSSSAASPPLSPGGSPVSIPQSDSAASPPSSPSSSPISDTQSDLVVSPSLSPASSSASVLQSAVADASSPISTTVEASDTSASPSASPLGPSASVPESEIATAPESSLSLAEAPSLSFTA